MANSIATAVQYINNDKELNDIFKTVSYTEDWAKPYKEEPGQKGKKISYRSFKVGTAGTTGTFNRATGYTAADITSSFVEKELKQEAGNALYLDAMDGDEAQSLEIAAVANRYIKDNLQPSVDKYRFTTIAATPSVQTKTLVLTSGNIEEELNAAISALYDAGVQGDLVLHISSAAYAQLSAANRLSIRYGEAWNGEVNNTVKTYGDLLKAKVVVVPTAILGKNVNFILSQPEAVCAIVKYADNEYFDKVPGFGSRKKEIDLGFYHDAWVIPACEKAIFVHKAA